jgi:hypothetical protein
MLAQGCQNLSDGSAYSKIMDKEIEGSGNAALDPCVIESVVGWWMAKIQPTKSVPSCMSSVVDFYPHSIVSGHASYRPLLFWSDLYVSLSAVIVTAPSDKWWQSAATIGM